MKNIKLGLVMVTTLFFVSGCFMKPADYDNETMKKAEESAKSFLNNNYHDIKTIEVEDVYRGELGGLEVTGTVNNKYEFDMGLNESDFTFRSIGEEKGFPEMKEECKDKLCDY